MELALRLIGGMGPNTCTPVKLFVEEASNGFADTKELALGLAAGEANPLAMVGGLVEWATRGSADPVAAIATLAAGVATFGDAVEAVELVEPFTTCTPGGVEARNMSIVRMFDRGPSSLKL